MHSIRTRLSVLFILIVSVILGLSGIYSHYQLSRDLDRRFEQLRHGLITRLQISLPSALWDLDEAKVNSIIAAEMLAPEVRGIRVYDSAVNLFTGKMRDDAGKVVPVPPSVKISGQQVETDLYFQGGGVSDATGQSTQVGRVVVYFSREDIDAALRAEWLRKVAEVLVVDVGLVLALILSLRMAFDPLEQLRDALFDLAQHDSEEVEELPDNRRDEFGDVVRGFNQIQRKLKSVIERRRQAEHEAREASRKTEQAYVELKAAQDSLLQSEKLASLGGLVAGVAHEINTPVGVSLTSASVLKEATEHIRRSLDEGAVRKSEITAYIDTADESARLIMANAERAAHLIQSFKQIAADQTSEVRRKFDLHEYIDEVITSLHPKIKHTKAQIEVTCPNNVLMDGYPGAFAQVLTNLTINALTHAFEPDLPGTISIQVALHDSMISLEFSDDGKGIGADNLSRIFDPFFTTRRGQGGTGLGLNIVYNIITQQFGGAIAVQSELGRGTRFTLRFPQVAPVLAQV
ncbi:ATP-binding protein [Chitinivorax sp. PXF-14]|uniref:sensor histidine kinase n=1 Tax=Chitinivorax sp. PXF-14 TaxID=3230488 RepID=UPI00346691FA